jgi:choline dehydrogenase-like flavoprotein
MQSFTTPGKSWARLVGVGQIYFCTLKRYQYSRVLGNKLIRGRARRSRHRTQSMRRATTLRGMFPYMALKARCKPVMHRMTILAAVSQYSFHYGVQRLSIILANMYNGAVSLGIQPALDPNNGRAQGIFRLLRSVDPKTQTRSSARTNRYDRNSKRPNYHILPNTAVSRVIFENLTAVGVEYMDTGNGEKSTVRASKEVIIAAGSVHTPQILQLSGVGDDTLLRRFGIEPVSDLPGVGRNLQDHLVLKVNYNCK